MARLSPEEITSTLEAVELRMRARALVKMEALLTAISQLPEPQREEAAQAWNEMFDQLMNVEIGRAVEKMRQVLTSGSLELH